MPKTKRGVNPLIASHRRLLIEELIAEESAKGMAKMPKIERVNIRLSYGTVPTEFVLTADDETGMTMEEVKKEVDSLIMNGFTPPVQWAKNEDVVGKKGTVLGVSPVKDTKMYEVLGALDDGGKEFKWRVFSPTTFRKNDRFQIVKNDRGFKEGELIIDDGEQQELPI